VFCDLCCAWVQAFFADLIDNVSACLPAWLLVMTLSIMALVMLMTSSVFLGFKAVIASVLRYAPLGSLPSQSAPRARKAGSAPLAMARERVRCHKTQGDTCSKQLPDRWWLSGLGWDVLLAVWARRWG
jgi:hypothetical protein